MISIWTLRSSAASGGSTTDLDPELLQIFIDEAHELVPSVGSAIARLARQSGQILRSASRCNACCIP